MIGKSRVSSLVLAGVLGLSAMVNAQTGSTLITRPFDDASKVEVNVSGQWQGKADSDNAVLKADDEIQLQIYDAKARWQISQDELGLTFGTQLTAIGIARSSTLPNSLMDQSFALGFHIGAISDWKISTVLGVGYNGRSPYGDANAYYGKADLIFTNQPTDTTQWQVIIDYNGNRSFMPDLPMPSIAYTDWSNEQFTWTVGFPYNSFTWEPSDKLEVKFGAMLIYDIRASVTYEMTESLALFGQYASRTDAFRADNSDRSDRRVIFSQQSVELGLVYEPCDEFELTVAGGYAFDQNFDYGFDTRDTDTITEVSDEPFLRIAAMVKF